MEERRRQKLLSVAQKRQMGFIVVLEDIHDPHNAAAILRTCDAFGVQTVYFVFQEEKPYNPKRIGKASSSSANKWLDITIFNSTSSCLAALNKDGYTIMATDLSPVAQNIYDAVLSPGNIALVVGNEHRGVSAEMLKKSDMVLAIPMVGMVQSLNVSVAAALCIAEIIRKRSIQTSFLYPEGRTQELVSRWVEGKKS